MLIMTDKKLRFSLLFLFMCLAMGWFFVPPGFPGNPETGIILSSDTGAILYEKNRVKRFVPASILKILTGLTAIHTLGPEYRFPTGYGFDPVTKDLYIKGFGDPLFTSEVIEQLCLVISDKTDRIHDIILDHSYFSEEIRIPGKGSTLNPYDASIGALCANFNTVMFTWNTRSKTFESGEPQTPLLSIFLDDIKRTGLKKGRIVLKKKKSRLYPGLLIRHFLEKKGVEISGTVYPGRVDEKKGKLKLFFSPIKIETLVQKLLKYSNNYIANQLLISLGAKKYGAPATLEKGVEAMKLFSKHEVGLDALTVDEGSGLSRANRISPDQMLKILMEFMPFRSLLNQKGRDFYKTGTLAGVRTRAGYIMGEDNKPYPYVIMLNTKNKANTGGYESIRQNLLGRVYKLTREK